MDASHLVQLRSEADKGNPVAERFLLHHWLVQGESDAISELLQSKRAAGQVQKARFIEAELSCFHGWKTDASWQELLQQCCNDGHPEADFVYALYRDWATFLDADDSGASDSATRDDPFDWQPPRWETIVAREGLMLERSSAYAPKNR